MLAAGTAGLIYAVTPQLISETRNLNGRAFASLLQTITMLVLLRSVIPSERARQRRWAEQRRRACGSSASCSWRAALQHAHQHDDRVSGERGDLTVVFGEPRS